MFANAAWASATMKDVETAVDVNHNYRQAESLISELVANNPNDARDHWVYSQILHHNNKDEQALHEVQEAKRLDPAVSFVKDPRKVNAFEASLKAGVHSAASPAPTPAPAPVMQPRITQQSVAAPIAPEPLQVEHKSGHTLLWVILILVVVGAAAFYFARRTQESDKREDDGRMNTARQEQLKQANALLESVKPFKLDIRIANPPKPELLAELDQVEQELVSLIERISQALIAQIEIDRLSDRLAQLHRQFEGKSDPAPAAQPAYQNRPVGQFNENEFSPVGMGGGTPVYQPTQGMQGMQPMQGMQAMQPIYQQAMPQTVYVENNSGGMGVGGGLVAGMVLGSLMGGERDREVIHEVREVREVREVPERRYDNDGGNQSDIDFGNESTSDNSSIDFGDSDDNN